MKKYLLALTLPTIIGLAVIFFPRPSAAAVYHPVPHEQVIHDLADLVRNSETLSQELRDTHMEIASMVLDEHSDCLVCWAAALLMLRSNDENWADTLGECIDDDELDRCISEVLYDSECKHKW